MSRKQTQGARQHALPGCCSRLPIVINQDDKPAPTRTNKNTMARVGTVVIGEQWRDQRQGRVDRPAIQVEQPQRCRVSLISSASHVSYRKINYLQKRTLQNSDEDNEVVNEGPKRLRLSGEIRVRGQGSFNHNMPHLTRQPFRQNNQPRFTNVNTDYSEPSLADLEASLRTMQRGFDERRTVVRNVELAEEQSRLEEKAERARKAEMQDHRFRSTAKSSLYTMWQDCDREREVAEELRQAREREEREQVQMKQREEEQSRQQELAKMKNNLEAMWEAHDIGKGMPSRIRPGQLSEAGQRRARERAEALRRRKQ